MSSVWIPPCLWCKHFHNDTFIERVKTCAAFQDAIPEDIWTGYFDHRKSHAGDQGLQFEEQTDVSLLPRAFRIIPDDVIATIKKAMYDAIKENIRRGKPPKRKDGQIIN